MKINKYTLILLLLFFYGASVQAQLGRCKGKYLGNITAYSVPSNYTGLWNQTTSENGSKWGTCDRGNGVYNFGNSDLAYNTAKNSGGAFKFHALIWGAQAPGYLKDASPAQIETAIRNWYQAVENHYDPMGGLEMIDVLNEPVNTPINREIANLKAALTRGYQSEPANQGDLNNPYGWAIWPFQLARKHFPDAELLINEFNVEHNWNNCRAEYIRMSNAIKNAPNLTDGQKNIIDGIGLQAHGIETLSANAWRNCIDEVWEKTGLPIHISEIDIAADPNEAHQRTKFSEFIPIAWEHPHVAGITLWGYIQGATWRPGNGQTGPGGTDTGIMYENGQDRPAMAWLREYMASQPSLPCCPDPGSFAGCSGPTPPAVSITTPATNTGFESGSSITFTANASDGDGNITLVEFFNGTTKLGEAATAPYSFTWNNAAVGSYSITAKATDNSGSSTTSEAINILVNVPQSPYGGSAHVVPGTVQFEEYDLGGNGFAYYDDSPGSAVTPVVNFRTDEDVDIENSTDAGAGYNLGFTTAGEWLEYTVDVTKSGMYDLELRVACAEAGRTITITMDGDSIATDVSIPNTTGWQTWQTVTLNDIALISGQKVMRLTIGAEDYVNLNYATFELTEEFVKGPYNGTAALVPGRIEAENYDEGREGLGYHEFENEGNQGDADYRNDQVDIEATQDVDGGYNVGYIRNGEWLAYTVDVQSSGLYDIDFRMAADGDGKVFHIEVDGVDVSGPIAVPNTGGWQTWETVTVNDIDLTSGEQEIRIVFDSDYMNFNYMEFSSQVVTSLNSMDNASIEIYPNPFGNNGFVISSENAFEYSLIDVSGSLMESGESTGSIKVGKTLPQGIYFLRIENSEGNTIQKLVKQ